MHLHPWHRRLLVCAIALSASGTGAATLIVTVEGVDSDSGVVGCALFHADAAQAFPLDTRQAVTQRSAARPGRSRCAFEGLAAGRYAVSAAHDRNGNGKTDRNLVGLPIEPWAVSNHVRPTLRAPRFSEAEFTLSADETRLIELQLAR